MMNIFDFLKNKTSTRSIKDQLFDQILIVVFCVSIVNIIGNFIVSFPVVANIKWVVLIIITLFVNHFKDDSIWVRYFIVSIVIFVMLPIGWYNSGAGSNNVIAYIFIITVAICFLFDGYFRFTLILMINFVFIFFLYIEFYMPGLLVNHNPNLQFFDRLIQIPMILLATYFMVRQFANTFYKKNELLNELNAKLEEIAYQDDLTLVNNRTFIFERYQENIARNNSFISLMMDIDDFKLVNDEYGHLDGDELLRELGTSLKIHFGDFGYIARYGGDEFILLLNVDPDTLIYKLNVFLDYFSNQEIVRKTATTLSGGYGTYYTGQTLDEHLRSIDEALYKAKHLGKNKIIQA